MTPHGQTARPDEMDIRDVSTTVVEGPGGPGRTPGRGQRRFRREESRGLRPRTWGTGRPGRRFCVGLRSALPLTRSLPGSSVSYHTRASTVPRVPGRPGQGGKHPPTPATPGPRPSPTRSRVSFCHRHGRGPEGVVDQKTWSFLPRIHEVQESTSSTVGTSQTLSGRVSDRTKATRVGCPLAGQGGVCIVGVPLTRVRSTTVGSVCRGVEVYPGGPDGSSDASSGRLVPFPVSGRRK